jgi:hypothetical protein
MLFCPALSLARIGLLSLPPTPTVRLMITLVASTHTKKPFPESTSFNPGDGSSNFLRNVRILLKYYSASQSRRPQLTKSRHITTQRSDRLWGTPSSFPRGEKRPGREADHSFLSSAEVKNGGAMLPLPIHIHCVVLN